MNKKQAALLDKIIAAGTLDTKTNRYVSRLETFEHYKHGLIDAYIIRYWPINDIANAPKDLNYWKAYTFIRKG